VRRSSFTISPRERGPALENVRACCRDDEDRDVHFGNRVEQSWSVGSAQWRSSISRTTGPLAAAVPADAGTPEKLGDGNGSLTQAINAERRSITRCVRADESVTFATAIAFRVAVSTRARRPERLDQGPNVIPSP